MKKLTLLLSVILCLGLRSADAQINNLFDFSDTTGKYPYGYLTLSGNVLYGTAPQGGANNVGNIFSINTDGSGYKDLWDFDDTGTNGNANGNYSGIALTLSGNTLYGVTSDGGANDRGVIYAINANGSGYKDLWDFDDTGSTGNANGRFPRCKLVLVRNKLYGMTSYGGANDDGLIFSINTDGSGYKDLWDFDDTGANGENPYGSLILSGKVLYGTTENGGRHSYGNVFSIDTDGAAYKDLFDFGQTTAEYPVGSLIIAGNKLYGTAYRGGGGYGDGVIFSIDTNGAAYKNLLYFNGVNGSSPRGSLTLSGNTLYGTSSVGGLYGEGTIFAIDTSGKGYVHFLDFNASDGGYPEEGGILSGGTLYGLTSLGGTYGYGNIYSYDLCSLLTSMQYESATDTGACNGIAAVIPNGGPSPFTYMWQGGQTTDTITGVCQGTYTCTITDKNGCSTTTSVTVGITTGINEVKGESGNVKVYPNPSNGIFNVVCHSERSEESPSKIEIYNILGEQVLTETLHSVQGDNTINISNQPGGIYLYRVITPEGNLVGQGKLIIQK